MDRTTKNVTVYKKTVVASGSKNKEEADTTVVYKPAIPDGTEPDIDQIRRMIKVCQEMGQKGPMYHYYGTTISVTPEGIIVLK